MKYKNSKILQVLSVSVTIAILFSCSNDPEKVIKDFNQATINLEYHKAMMILKAMFPKKIDYDHFYYYGIAFKNLNELDSAETNFNRAISLDSNRYEPYLRLSEVYLAQNEIDLALPYIEKANSIDPNNVNILFQFANLYSLKKDKEKTLYYFQLAAEKEPENPLALSNLGIYYLRNGELNKAENHLKKASFLNSDKNVKAKINENLGVLYYNLDDFELAKVYFNNSFNQMPKNENINFHLGIIYAKEGNHSKAIAHFSNSINSKGNDDKTYFNRAISYYELNQVQEAIKDLDQAIQLNGKIPEYYVLRGQSKLTIGEHDEGCIDFKKAKTLGFTSITDAINEYCL